jgi:hypothetical protein
VGGVVSRDLRAEREARTSLALVALGSCLLCRRTPAGSVSVFVPNDRPGRLTLYALCGRCHSEDGWAWRAERALCARGRA